MASVLENGAVAQLGERLLCKQEVVGSIPSGSTSLYLLMKVEMILFFEIVEILMKVKILSICENK